MDGLGDKLTDSRNVSEQKTKRREKEHRKRSNG